MEWNESTTRQYLGEHGVAYRTCKVLGPGSTYAEQFANQRDSLNSPHTPYLCMLRYGQVGDTAPDSFTGWRRHDLALAARLGSDAIVQYENVLELVTREGSPIEAQIGGTLDDFLTRLRAWHSMATNLYPQNPFASGY